MSSGQMTVTGWILLAAGGVLYLGSIVAAVLRVGRQYSRAMPGHARLHVGAALAAAGKSWIFLTVAIIGAALVILGR